MSILLSPNVAGAIAAAIMLSVSTITEGFAMHRIDGAGATPQNTFTEGDPGTGLPATVVTADWLNAIQEEIAAFIEASGAALDKQDNAQMLAAFNTLVANAGWNTGDVKLSVVTTAPAGWVMCDDGTIGSAASGATARANADTEDLYTLLWTNVADAWAPVTGGRGASAAVDFASDKPIALTKMLGRALAISGTGASLTARALGENLGAETHTLTLAELPDKWYGGGNANGAAGGGGNPSTGEQGGGDPHNNMQPTAFLNAMIRL